MAQQEPTAPFEGSEQNLVFALNEKWDTNTLAWIKDTGTGGGGGAVTVADGADVAQGAVGDVAWVSGNGTVISILKTIAAGGAGLTDAQLRATPVPVSGTLTVNTGLTDAQLRATPVPVSGTVTANTGLTQPLTDAELRATPVPVSGTVVANPTGYVVRLDEASSTITYVGFAVPGTATSAASWAIKRLDSTSGLVVLWADGNSNFDNIWDDRASLSYS